MSKVNINYIINKHLIFYFEREIYRMCFTHIKEFVNFSSNILRIIWHKCIQCSFVKNYTELTIIKSHVQCIHLLIHHINTVLSMGILHLFDYHMTDVNICYMSEINVKTMDFIIWKHKQLAHKSTVSVTLSLSNMQKLKSIRVNSNDPKIIIFCNHTYGLLQYMQ